MNSLGIAPPLMAFTKAKPAPRSCDSILSRTWPYWPRPPDCLIYLPSASAEPLMVSLYATCGRPIFASTLNSRRMRSTKTSKCNSPIPEIIVSPVSGSPDTRNVGSSSAKRCNAIPIFSWSAFVFGSTRAEITGSGKSIFSRINGFSGSQSVSPVEVSFKPTKPPISPAKISSISSRWLACKRIMRPMRS